MIVEFASGSNVKYIHQFVKTKNWFARADLNIYAQENFNAHKYDLFYAKAYAGLGYQKDKMSIYVPFFYGHMNYLEKDLLREYGIAPDINFMLKPSVMLKIQGDLHKKEYLNDSDDKGDSDIAGIGAKLYRFYKKGYIAIRTKHERHNADDSDHFRYTEKNVHYFGIGGSYMLPHSFKAKADYLYRVDAYKDRTRANGTGSKRNDDNNQITLSLERPVFKNILLEARYRYIDNRTNYEIADYKKQIVTLGLQYSY